jgi:hypothetical protein
MKGMPCLLLPMLLANKREGMSRLPLLYLSDQVFVTRRKRSEIKGRVATVASRPRDEEYCIGEEEHSKQTQFALITAES